MSLEPTATGTLQATPFGHLLVYLLDRGLTGTLVLEEATGDKHAVWFETGAPAKVKTATPVTYLGQVLVEQRAITREVYERTLQGALHERRLHGEILLETGAVDQRVLRDALREQLARQVLWLFKLAPSTAYGYYDQVNFLERWGAPEGLRTRPLALIWRGLRRHASVPEIEAVTARLGDRPIELHVDAPIRRFKFASSEQALVDVLRAKPQPLSSLVASGLAAPEDVKRLVYVLVILRQLELGVPGAEPVGVDEAPSSSRIPIAPVGRGSFAEIERPQPVERGSIPDVEHVVPSQRFSDAHRVASPVPAAPSPIASSVPPQVGISSPIPASPRLSSPIPTSPRISSSAPASPGISVAPASPPQSLSPVGTGSAEQRLELETLTARARGTHYEVLGVPRDAPASVIQNAFFGLAKKWHPDRLRPEMADLKDQATRLFARISEASQVLADPASRREYDQSLSGGGDGADEVAQVQKVLRATTAFQKAEVLLKRGNLALAEKEALIAFENDPSQADHVALHVWIQAQKPDANLTDLAVQLEKAAKAEPNNLRVRWYRGQLLKRLGRAREALHDFRFIVERDPRHTDAHREVRLYAMRRGNRPPSDPPGTGSHPPSPDSHGGRKSSPPAKPGGLLNKLFKKP
ncbi:MAG TPA: DnaJ domain-containing protein [Polyangiaceae bacterium]|nr:DnaJ domain-containing protein [Polyangiaceae bacterium]